MRLRSSSCIDSMYYVTFTLFPQMAISKEGKEQANGTIFHNKQSLVLRQLYLLLILLVLLITQASTEGEACHCIKIVYLEQEKSGRVPCSCGNFDAVSWYTKEGFDNLDPPFIYFDNVEKRGPGYISGEYDIGLNGSLIITNVTWLEMVYYVKYLQHVFGRTDPTRVHAVVIVPPVPLYPVVNDLINQQLIYMDVERNGKLNCSVRNVHPKVNLVWEVIDPSNSDKIDIHYNDMDSFPNEDGTFNVTLTSLYRANLFERTSVIQCKVTNQISKYFPAVVTVGLVFPPVPTVPPVPVIDGCYNQPDHCLLKVERTGDITCIVMNTPYLVNLKWSLLAETSQYTFKEEIGFQNKSTSFDLFSIMSYSVMDRSLSKLTAHCEMTNVDDGFLLAKKTVSVSLLVGKADDINSVIHQIKRLTVAVLTLMTLMMIFFGIAFAYFTGICRWLKENTPI